MRNLISSRTTTSYDLGSGEVMRRTAATVFIVATLVGCSDNRPPCGDAVDQKREPEAEPSACIVGECRLLVGQVCARGVPLQSRLLVGGEAQHVVDDGAGGEFGVCSLHARVGCGVGEV